LLRLITKWTLIEKNWKTCLTDSCKQFLTHEVLNWIKDIIKISTEWKFKFSQNINIFIVIIILFNLSFLIIEFYINTWMQVKYYFQIFITKNEWTRWKNILKKMNICLQVISFIFFAFILTRSYAFHRNF
jgi:hypothetical protein